MARPRQPREIADLKGAPSKNPQRYRNKPPKSEYPLGDAPEHLSDDAIACWREISMHSLPGVMTHADSLMLEVVSNLFAEYREDPPGFLASKYTHLIGILARFGMSPSDRTKLGVDPKETDNPLDHLDD